ncbi:hypothetical protein BH10PSE7_BH10PSE7_05890 [soil metagenome]
MNGERGSVLIIVLSVIATLAVMVGVLNATVRKSAWIARVERQRVATQGVLDGGIEIAVQHLIRKDPALRWSGDGREYRVATDDNVLSIRIRDVSGLIDINRADEALIRGLIAQFASLSDATVLTKRILDWRKPKLGVPAGVFLFASQISEVLNANAELIQRISPFLTFYGRAGRVNPLTAPPEVLASLPLISPGEVTALIQARQKGDLNGSDAEAILAKFDNFLDRGAPSIFIVTVEAGGPAILPSSRAEATVLLGANEAVPYYVLAWSW